MERTNGDSVCANGGGGERMVWEDNPGAVAASGCGEIVFGNDPRASMVAATGGGAEWVRSTSGQGTNVLVDSGTGGGDGFEAGSIVGRGEDTPMEEVGGGSGSTGVDPPSGGGDVEMREGDAGGPTVVSSESTTPVGSLVETLMSGVDVLIGKRELVHDPEVMVEQQSAPDSETVGASHVDKGKGPLVEGEFQEAGRPASVPLFVTFVGTSTERGVTLEDTVEFVWLGDVAERLRESPLLDVTLGVECLESAHAEETARQRQEELEEERRREEEERELIVPRVSLVDEVAQTMRTYTVETDVPQVHFFAPYGLGVYRSRRAFDPERVVHDAGTHLGSSEPLVCT